MATAPEILYRNLPAISQAGRGDGTIYAWGTTAVPDTSAKTFDLTTVNIMTDLGADADDLFNGYVLVFTSSGRSYLITDWVAATDLATTFETPNTEDTGAWTIRRTLYTNDFAAANPLRYAAIGKLYQLWKDSAANNNAVISIAAPNGIDDGGFEKNSLTDYWTTRGVAGTGTVAINATTPILGTYDCKLNQGDQVYVGLEQAGKIDLDSSKTYGIKFKAGGDAGAVSDLRVSLEYVAGAATRVPVTFTKINVDDDIATANIWKPAITDATAWEEIKFTVSEDIDAGDYKLVFDQYDAVDVFIDEISLFEVISPDTLIIGNHNHAGGYAATSYLGGRSCPSDLTSVGASDYDLTLVDLDADVTVDGNSPIYETFTAPTSIYPIYEISLVAISGKTWQAGEIWLGARWTWERFVAGKWAPFDGDIRVNSVTSFGGVKVESERYRKRKVTGRIPLISDADFAVWKDFIAEVGVGGVFWYRMAALTDPIVGEELMLMRCSSRPVIRALAGNLSVDSFSFEESF